ncbi:MAG: riboflavin synthase [Hornefia sp.]|nr:riboflavin synthase [Hornefia sp.]
MFTGIVEEVGRVKSIRRGSGEAKIIISCSKVLGKKNTMSSNLSMGIPTITGDSIAVNGICLTVTELRGDTFTADVMPETFARSSLSSLRPGSKVNLERAMPSYGRFGGHIVSGHIDGIGKISAIKRDGNAVWFTIEADQKITEFIVEKGSITIDGISLTVAAVAHTEPTGKFQVSVIPHTLSETSLSEKKAGDLVNLETDIIGKYVKQFFGEENK